MRHARTNPLRSVPGEPSWNAWRVSVCLVQPDSDRVEERRKKAGPQRRPEASGRAERPGGERENRVSSTIGDLVATACQRFANRSGWSAASQGESCYS